MKEEIKYYRKTEHGISIHLPQLFVLYRPELFSSSNATLEDYRYGSRNGLFPDEVPNPIRLNTLIICSRCMQYVCTTTYLYYDIIPQVDSSVPYKWFIINIHL